MLDADVKPDAGLTGTPQYRHAWHHVDVVLAGDTIDIWRCGGRAESTPPDHFHDARVRLRDRRGGAGQHRSRGVFGIKQIGLTTTTMVLAVGPRHFHDIMAATVHRSGQTTAIDAVGVIATARGVSRAQVVAWSGYTPNRPSQRTWSAPTRPHRPMPQSDRWTSNSPSTASSVQTTTLGGLTRVCADARTLIQPPNEGIAAGHRQEQPAHSLPQRQPEGFE